MKNILYSVILALVSVAGFLYGVGFVQGKALTNLSQDPIPYSITLHGLIKELAWFSTSYVVTNTGSVNATYVHVFYDQDGSQYTIFDNLNPGSGKIYDLENLESIPNGFKGYVVIASDQPMTATVLPEPIPPLAIEISGIVTGTTETQYPYSASVTTISTTLPITITWEATNLEKVVKTTEALTDQIELTWIEDGNKTITVAAMNGGGIVTDTQKITIYPISKADFYASPVIGVVPMTVTFMNISEGDYSSSHWEFGDGQISFLDNPTHIYDETGCYSVTLTVDGNGGESQETKIGYIKVYSTQIFIPLVTR